MSTTAEKELTQKATWHITREQAEQGLAHCKVEKRDLMLWVFDWCFNNQITMRHFAGVVDYHESKISQMYRGAYKDPEGTPYDIPDKLFHAAQAWKLLQLQGASKNRREFVQTSIVDKVQFGLDLARESQTPVFIYGASHIGKTFAAADWCSRHENAHLIRIPAVSTVKGLVVEIAEYFGQSIKGTKENILKRIKKQMKSEMTLVFDEMHSLTLLKSSATFFACIETLRELYDYSNCGVAFIATNLDRSRFEQERKGDLEQMARRGVHRVQLGNEVPQGDIRLVFANHGIAFPKPKDTYQVGDEKQKPYHILKELAQDHGLKAIAERIRYAQKFALRQDQPMTFEHFMQAHFTIALNAQMPKSDWE